MIGAQGLIEGVIGRGTIVGDGVGVMMIVRVGRSGHAQQQRRGRAVVGLLHPGGSSVVCLVILTCHRLGALIRVLVGDVLRGGGGGSGGGGGGGGGGVCRVFVNVCEVREWSGPGVAA